MIKPLTISVFQDEVCCSPHWKRSHSRESSWECSARKVVACHTADTILIIVFPLGLVFRQRWVEPSASSYRTRPATSRGRPWWWPGGCTLGCDQTLLIIMFLIFLYWLSWEKVFRGWRQQLEVEDPSSSKTISQLQHPAGRSKFWLTWRLQLSTRWITRKAFCSETYESTQPWEIIGSSPSLPFKCSEQNCWFVAAMADWEHNPWLRRCWRRQDGRRQSGEVSSWWRDLR